MKQWGMLKIGIGVIVILVVGGLAVWWLAGNPKGTADKGKHKPAAATTAVVEITATGFLPSTIAVHPNTEVVWVNEDVMPHLPAADPYPSHSSLPSLVAPKALGQKETYSFLFTKQATIHYHDDLQPTWVGMVEVR